MRKFNASFLSVLTVTAFLVSGISPATAAPTSVSEMLGSLGVTQESESPKYNRAAFNHWIDANKNGCDTRAEVLISESKKKVTRKGKCTIVGGEWLSAYDSSVIKIASKLDVDHLVPLAEAWRSGASKWSPSVRQSFANDLGVSYALVAVSAGSNRSKGDKDPAKWLPSNSEIICNYIGSWIAMKYRWSLSVDTAEKSELSSKLDSCGEAADVAIPEVKFSSSGIFPIPSNPTPSPKAVVKPSGKVANIAVEAPKESPLGGAIDVKITATDINGKPVSGVQITYSDSSGFVSGEGPITDSEGKSAFSITLNPEIKYLTAIIFKGGQSLGSHVVWIKEVVNTPSPGPIAGTPTPNSSPTPSALDPRYSTCTAAKGSGYGPYYRSTDPEYYWYIDRDKDGIVCE